MISFCINDLQDCSWRFAYPPSPDLLDALEKSPKACSLDLTLVFPRLSQGYEEHGSCWLIPDRPALFTPRLAGSKVLLSTFRVRLNPDGLDGPDFLRSCNTIFTESPAISTLGIAVADKFTSRYGNTIRFLQDMWNLDSFPSKIDGVIIEDTCFRLDALILIFSKIALGPRLRSLTPDTCLGCMEWVLERLIDQKDVVLDSFCILNCRVEPTLLFEFLTSFKGLSTLRIVNSKISADTLWDAIFHQRATLRVLQITDRNRRARQRGYRHSYRVGNFARRKDLNLDYLEVTDP